jgi:hypothetical protein
MTIKSALFIIFTALICLNITFSCSFISEPPSFYVNLMVPYHQQDVVNYCAPACVQMWAHYDGRLTTQDNIAYYMGMVPYEDYVSPYELERAVGNFTNSEGYLARKDGWQPGAQGDLIAATIEGIKYGVPSIMPFQGDHVVLIKGYKWREKADGTPFAIRVYYHDPNDYPDQNIPANDLLALFVPAPFDYWVIVGRSEFADNGVFGHDIFVLMGGTYYGGSAYYNPKGLDLTQPMY